MVLPAWILRLKRPFLIGVATACVAALLSLLMPNYYKSEARVLPIEAKGLGGNLGGLAVAAAAFGVAVPGGDGSDANFVDILGSRTLRERLLETVFTFKERSWRFGMEKPRMETLESYLRQANRDRSLNAFSNMLTVSRDMKSKVITISAETKSPELSQQIVRTSLKLLEEFIQEKGRTRGGAKAAFAESRLEEANKEMAGAEDQLRRFLDGNRNYQSSSDPAVKLKGMRLEAELKLRQQLVSALSMSHEQALMEEKNDIPILNVLDPGSLPQDKSRPTRSTIVELAFLMGMVGAGVWLNRAWILDRLMEEGKEKSGGS